MQQNPDAMRAFFSRVTPVLPELFNMAYALFQYGFKVDRQVAGGNKNRLTPEGCGNLMLDRQPKCCRTADFFD